ncbi:MAG: bile acid:sodium symporter family protein [Cyclobacteriaceae bacterium]|nr:bile acid:sodium symporter family protein [Cyclobacteriaceae bacterium]
MFGIALDIKWEDFKKVFRSPKATLVGLLLQFLLLPATTFILVWVLQPAPSIALGMILVAACPGGNISNFMTHLSKGNTALSVSLTSIGTLLAIVMTPLNLQVWASLYPPTAAILNEVSLNPWEMFETIAVLIGIPLVLGMAISSKYPTIAATISKRVKPFSIFIFAMFVIVAFANNLDTFLEFIHLVIIFVFIHNLIALTLGYNVARLFRLSLENRKTLAIETGIQNSGLGLILIFGFFQGLGGMAIVAAWWGIWHIVSGLAISTYWSRNTATQAT